jgi:hypothetical protein
MTVRDPASATEFNDDRERNLSVRDSSSAKEISEKSRQFNGKQGDKYDSENADAEFVGKPGECLKVKFLHHPYNMSSKKGVGYHTFFPRVLLGPYQK